MDTQPADINPLRCGLRTGLILLLVLSATTVLPAATPPGCPGAVEVADPGQQTCSQLLNTLHPPAYEHDTTLRCYDGSAQMLEFVQGGGVPRQLRAVDPAPFPTMAEPSGESHYWHSGTRYQPCAYYRDMTVVRREFHQCNPYAPLGTSSCNPTTVGSSCDEIVLVGRERWLVLPGYGVNQARMSPCQTSGGTEELPGEEPPSL